MVFRHANGVGLRLEREFHHDVVLLRTQDDTDGWVVAVPTLLFIEQVQIEVHLAGILRLERTNLQLHCHQRLKKTVIEQQLKMSFQFSPTPTIRCFRKDPSIAFSSATPGTISKIKPSIS